jgi:hypothetical protein
VKPYCENNLQLQVVELDEHDPTHFFVMNTLTKHLLAGQSVQLMNDYNHLKTQSFRRAQTNSIASIY